MVVADIQNGNEYGSYMLKFYNPFSCRALKENRYNICFCTEILCSSNNLIFIWVSSFKQKCIFPCGVSCSAGDKTEITSVVFGPFHKLYPFTTRTHTVVGMAYVQNSVFFYTVTRQRGSSVV